jgi:hypothetical protein
MKTKTNNIPFRIWDILGGPESLIQEYNLLDQMSNSKYINKLI